MERIGRKVCESVNLLSKFPSIQCACTSIRQGSSGGVEAIVTYTQSALETSESVKFERHFCIDGTHVIYQGPPQYLDPKSCVCYSPSLARKIVFRRKSPEKESSYIIDIWSDHHLQSSIDLAAAKKHGSPYLLGDLASFDWSPSEKYFLYLAEQKRPQSSSYFDPWCPSDAVRGAESQYYEDWGEQMCGQHQSVVVVLDLASAILRTIDSPDSCCLGQARWLGEKTVYAVAFQTAPQRLGLVYCTTRRSSVMKLSLDAAEDVIESVASSSSTPQSCRSIRVSPDLRCVVWLQTNAGGPHHKGSRLMSLNTATGDVLTLVDIVQNPSDFCGIYIMHLPDQCFLSDHEVCFSTQHGTKWASYIVDVITGQRLKLDGDDFQILSARSGVITCVVSSLLQPHRLHVRIRTETGGWLCAKIGPELPNDQFPGYVEHLVFERDSGDALSDIPYTGLLAAPLSSTAGGPTSCPLIVFPHGGPHGVMVNSWSQHVTLFVMLGFGVLLVNYRGSAGAGERSLHSLLGRVGRLDVDDCAHAIRRVLSRKDLTISFDGARVGAYGGSHGGFLVNHLGGQYPDLVSAVVARNPVCDISGMLSATDIPDWCFVEACGGDGGTGDYKYGAVPSTDQLSRMLEMSPVSHVDSVSAPTLLLLGRVDRRVVPSQAEFYHRALLSRGVVSELRSYDDCHPLAKAAVNGDVMVHSAVWFCRHLGHDPLL